MTDKRAIQSYWKDIGNDMWVVLGRKMPKMQKIPNGWSAVVNGIKTLNPFVTSNRSR